MKRHLLYFISVVLTVIVIFSLYNLKTERDKYDDLKIRYEQSNYENSILLEGMFHSYDFSFQNIDFKETYLIHKGQRIPVEDHLAGKFSLILLVNLSQCNSCALDQIRFINRFFEKDGINSFIGISGLNERDYYSFVSNYGISDISFMITKENFSGFHISPIVYFVFDGRNSYSCFFAPTDHLPLLTEVYLDKIKALFNL